MSDPNQDEAQKKAAQGKADRERMEALGRDPENPVLFDAYQKNQEKLAAGRINEQEARENLDRAEYLERNKQIRAAAAQKVAEQAPGQQIPEPEQTLDWKALKNRDHPQLTKSAPEQGQDNSQQPEQTANWKALLKDPERLREVQEQFREQHAQMLRREDGNIPSDRGGRERKTGV